MLNRLDAETESTAPPITLPALAFLKTPPDDDGTERRDIGAEFLEARIVIVACVGAFAGRSGDDAMASCAS